MVLLVSAAPTFRKSMFAAASSLWAPEPSPILLTYGMPAFDTYDDVVSLGAVTSTQEEVTMGTNRSREETVTLEVIFYCFRNGGQEQEVIVQDRAYYLLGTLENYVRVTDPQIGTTIIRQVQLSNFSADEATDQEVLSHGRLYVLSATFTAQARITS